MAPSRLQRLRATLGYADFRRLWLSQLASDTGDSLGRIALAILVFDETGSSLATAGVFAVTVAPYFGIGQALTSWAERFPRRTVLIAADSLRALCFAAIAAPVPLTVRFVLLLIASLADPPFLAVRRALVPTTIPDERYADAVTITTVTTEVAILVGAGLGGVLVALLSAPGALLVDAATFAVSALLLVGVNSGRAVVGATASVRAQLRRGWRSLVEDPLARHLFWLFPLVSAGALGTEALLAPLVDTELQLGEAWVGVLAATISGGVLLATAVLPERGRDHAALNRQAALIATVGGAVAVAGFASATTTWSSIAGYLGIGIVFACRVPTSVVLGQRLGDDVRASALSVLDGAYAGAQVVAALGAGALADAVDPRTSAVVFAVIAFAGGAVGLASRSVRSEATG